MADVLLVDGYNIIGNWEELAPLKAISLEVARAKLCDILSRYVSYRWDRIIVVFDAYQVAGRKQENPGNTAFDVVFSGEGETADLVIERLTGKLVAKGHFVEVATSDALEQTLVLGKGAIRISARELRLQLQELDRKIGTKYCDSATCRTMLDSRLDKGVRAVFERWRRER